MKDFEKFVGQKTLEKMKATKWYAYARIIDSALYYTGIPARGLPGTIDCKEHILSVEHGSVVDVRKVLTDLARECERMALLEVT